MVKELDENFYELTPLLKELTVELKTTIASRVEDVANDFIYRPNGVFSTPSDDDLLTLAQNASIATIKAIQEKGQIFAIHPKYLDLGCTPWYADLTDRLFEDVNT